MLHRRLSAADFPQATAEVFKEMDGGITRATRAMPRLGEACEAVIQTLRGDLATAMDKFSDAGTSDFLTGLMEKHEKMAWMLRAFVEA